MEYNFNQMSEQDGLKARCNALVTQYMSHSCFYNPVTTAFKLTGLMGYLKQELRREYSLTQGEPVRVTFETFISGQKDYLRIYVSVPLRGLDTFTGDYLLIKGGKCA